MYRFNLSKLVFIIIVFSFQSIAAQEIDEDGNIVDYSITQKVIKAADYDSTFTINDTLSIPEGFEAQIRPRSGLALKHNITVLNTPGTIDSDYRGIVSLIIVNLGKQNFTVTRGMRLAQMVIQEVIRAEIEVVPELDLTERAYGGFGHTGQ